MTKGDDYRIISDSLVNGMRHITAQPSGLVCSAQIDFDIDGDGRLHNVRYIRGCEGNLKAIGRLLEGADAHKTAAILDGVDCHMRGTSCTDQLARILHSINI